MLRRVAWCALVALAGCYTSDLVERATDVDAGPGPGEGALDGGALFDGAVSDASADAAIATCSDGSPIVARFATCNASPLAASTTVTAALATASRGDVVALGGAASAPATDCFPVRVCVPATAPSMLFSDSPESPATSGVLYADTVGPGHYRIYVYHANGGNDGVARKFPVVVLNQGGADAHVKIVAKGVAGPSVDYVSIGKAAAARWLAPGVSSTVTVPPGARVLLDPDLDALHAGYRELVHAIYDVDLDAKVKLSVVVVDGAVDAAAATASLSLLAADSDHQRATFAQAERVIEADGPVPAAGVTHLSFGAGTLDADLTGTDRTNGNAAELVGNYGVVYTFVGAVTGDTAFALAPRGGAWAGAAVVSAGADGAAGAVSLPTATGATSADGSGIVLGRFAAGASVRARFVSAGGSSLPVSLVSVPLP